MKINRQFFEVIGTIVLLCATFRAHTPPAAAQSSPSQKVLADNADSAALSQLRTSGATLLADYGAFSLWRVPQNLRAPQRESVAALSDPDTIFLRGGARVNTELKTSATKTILQARTATAQLWLVQFIGPTKDEWLTQLQALGATPVQYMPNNAYVVWADGTAIDALNREASNGNPIQWTGEYQAAYRLAPELANLQTTTGFADVTVQIYNHANAQTTRAGIQSNASQTFGQGESDTFVWLSARLPVARLADVSALPNVFNVEPYAAPTKNDERQAQIVAGNISLSNSKLVPTLGAGYLAWLQAQGVPTNTNAYPVLAIVDDGIDNGSTAPLNPEFREFGNPSSPSRLLANIDCTTDGNANGGQGHGNLNAGIAVGYNNGVGAGTKDAAGYRYGLGISPFAPMLGVKIFEDDGDWSLYQCANDYAELVRRQWVAGARISSNSWGNPANGGYNVVALKYDQLVRDADPDTAGNQEMLQIFSAGNSGGNSGIAGTMGSPGTSKNVLAVGAGENVRDQGVTDGCGRRDADNVNDLIGFSSRGPTNDLRTKPDLIAPGTHVAGPATQGGFNGQGVCGGAGNLNSPPGNNPFYPAGQISYTWSSGTSHSAPAVSGAATLAYEYYTRVLQPARAPSAAMLKALLLNTGRYLNGVGSGGNLPSNAQGWGSVSLSHLYTDTPRIVLDQRVLFNNTGQIYTATGNVQNSARPFRITLAWTDAPGSTTGNAYVNDLDLTVSVNGQTYKGNVFSGANSVAGGLADGRNNVEGVYLPEGISGAYALTVTAKNIAGNGVPNINADATDQDFALIVFNGDSAGNTPAPVAGLELFSAKASEGTPSNGNQNIDPGERGTLAMTLTNVSNVTATNIVGQLGLPNGTVVVGSSAFVDVAPMGTSTNATPFVFDIPLAQPCGVVPVVFTATYALNSAPQVITTTFNIVVGSAVLGAQQRYTRTASLAIPDNNEAGVSSQIVLAGAGTVGDIDVRIDRLAHRYVGDLRIEMYSPSGRKATLMNRNGYLQGGNAVDGLREFALNDEATIYVGDLSVMQDGGVAFGGEFIPISPLSIFDGEPISGTWTLTMRDVAPQDAGTLVTWGLNVTPATIACNLPPTPTHTRTPTRTPTATRTPSATATATSTHTPTKTNTPSRTPVVVGPTLTPSTTPTPSQTPTPTQTSSPTPPPICQPVEVNPNANIPDNNATGVCFDMVVNDAGLVQDVSVKMGVSHTFLSDLKMTLFSPSGTKLTMMNRPGISATAYGDNSDLLASYPIEFRNGAPTNAEAMGKLLLSTKVVCRDDGQCAFAPNADGDAGSAANFSAFGGQPSAGTWRVCVSDNFKNDFGKVDSVRLSLMCSAAATPDPNATSTTTPNPTQTATPTATSTPITRDYCDPVSVAPNAVIADGNATPTCFAFAMPNGGRVQGGILQLAMDHTYLSDLKVQVISPMSQTLTVMNRPGIPATRYGDSSNLSGSYPITFTDSGATSAAQMGNTIGGLSAVCKDDKRCFFKPAPNNDSGSSLSTFAGFSGTATDGVWVVCVSDLSRNDVGTVRRATLDLACSAPPVAFVETPDVEPTPTQTTTSVPATPAPTVLPAAAESAKPEERDEVTEIFMPMVMR